MAATDKYDRQRLWGANGQKALMEARICLLNAGATGTETLKNLVLPGCGHVTVVDAATVSERDLANNFFVEPSRLGQPRAQAALELLLEMNDAGACCYACVSRSIRNMFQKLQLRDHDVTAGFQVRKRIISCMHDN